jgi:hypoxanthine phosphoribosyltransferase
MPADSQPFLEVLISRDAIARRVRALGAQLAQDYAGESLLLLGILKGSFVFLADLARAVPLDCRFDFVGTSSYGESVRSSGRVHLTKDTDVDLEGQNVLLVEDILDTGRTLSFLVDHLQSCGPKSLRIAALLDKPSRRVVPIQADYTGFVIEDKFVVGYGLDYAEKYRNLPDICVLSGGSAG